MAKNTKTIDSPAYGSRIAGIHVNCGGEVVYTFTPTRGYRSCKKCSQHTLRGDPVDVEKHQETT